MTAKFYAFDGTMATNGNPNPRTGRMSRWGNFVCFPSRKARDGYVDSNSNAVAVNKKTGRKYRLGKTMQEYLHEYEYETPLLMEHYSNN